MTDDLLRATVSVRAVIQATNGHVLAVRRSTDGDWELPGGRLSRGESPRQGLHREVHEETGLRVEITDVVKANSWVNTAGEDRFAVHYRCEAATEGVELSDEHVDSEWVRPGAAAQVLCETQVAAVHTATAGIETDSTVTDSSSLAQD